MRHDYWLILMSPSVKETPITTCVCNSQGKTTISSVRLAFFQYFVAKLTSAKTSYIQSIKFVFAVIHIWSVGMCTFFNYFKVTRF